MNRPLRILSYNVHSCFGTDRRLDPARVAEVIASCNADIVALQEVDVERARSGAIDQAQMIAAHLKMTAHFNAALHLEEERYGDALITALPTRLVKAAGLPSKGEPRGALWVEVMAGEIPLQMFVTHLGLRGGERMRQVETLMGPAWMGAAMPDNSRIVMAGDLNAVPRSAAYKVLARRYRDVQTEQGLAPKATFPSRLPLLRLDHIMVGEGIRVLETRVFNDPLARRASDHLPLLAVLDLDPAG
ncbi:EEP domain-containing protein [Agrobacterium sp. a22-2]|uniref:endonuclease/exonuclease/phosphatase family protein n=1 Tax=Agrobacterium sp. a22-2 TaxID=2283840 RepID=UPI0014477A7A|nr:endonuclease/exonuclease/phosphatase family protein [Agrobacterium sp. a22-2]NKN38701.1 EEP domain-containing protein [Agrobacterium sp. a22-2]